MPQSKQDVLKQFDELIALAEEKRRTLTDDNQFDDLYYKVQYESEALILDQFGETERDDFRSKTWRYYATEDLEDTDRRLGDDIILLKNYRKRLEHRSDGATLSEQNTITILEQLARRLPQVIYQLRQRHEDRPALDVRDEYDLQDLIHSLLLLYFDDIRKEEGTPSLAGTNGRMDFLLFKEKTVVELKMASANLRNKKLKEQLLADIPHYRKHQDCKNFVGIVYDPARYIQNSPGFETDLSEPFNNMPVRVFVVQG